MTSPSPFHGFKKISLVVLQLFLALYTAAQSTEKMNIIKRLQPFDTSMDVKNYLKGVSGWLYRVELVESKNVFSEMDEMKEFYSSAETELVRTCTEIQKPFQCNSENFAGCARREVKTSYSAAAPASYTLKGLLRRLARPKYADEAIKVKLKNFGDKQTQRLQEEDQSVTISNVYLFAIKQLPDNDYHMIICDKEKKNFITIELSGLPDHVANSSPLVKVRDYFNDKFAYNVSCNGKYMVFIDTIYPVKNITGTLFFDVNHDGGSVGPRNYAGPTTAWEIHPVTAIEFGDPIEQ